MADMDELLTPADMAAHLAVSVRSVRRYADCGLLEPVRLGRTVRYRRADVERLLTERQGASGHDTGQNGHSGQRTADMAGVAGVAPPVSAPVSAEGTGGAPALAEVSAQAVAALREELAALRTENGALRAELTAKAEAAGMWQGRARTLEEQLRQLTAGQPAPEAAPAAPGDAVGAQRGRDTPRRPAGLWRRLRRALRGD